MQHQVPMILWHLPISVISSELNFYVFSVHQILTTNLEMKNVNNFPQQCTILHYPVFGTWIMQYSALFGASIFFSFSKLKSFLKGCHFEFIENIKMARIDIRMFQNRKLTGALKTGNSNVKDVFQQIKTTEGNCTDI